MNRNVLVSVVIVGAVALGGYYYFNQANPTPPEPPASAAIGQMAVPASAAAIGDTSAAPTVPTESDQKNMTATIKTNRGVMEVEFYTDVAPETVKNFIKLAQEGFYNGTAFHRIVKGFMIQGGDPLTKDPTASDRYGTGDPGYKIKAEFNARKHTRGILSMARSANPDSAGSQFFICLDDAPFLDGKYTVFGKVTKGEDVLVVIGDTPVKQSPSGEMSVPLQRVSVESVTINSK